MFVGSAFFVVAGGMMCAGALAGLAEASAGVSTFALVVTVLGASFYFIVGLVTVLFFGSGLLYFASRLFFFRQPVFEVGPEGILDRASATGVGFVPWREVKKVGFATIHGQRFIEIRVKNERELLERQNPIKRLLIRTNRRYFDSGPINVPLNTLAIPAEELVAGITRHLLLQGEAVRSSLRAEEGATANRRRPTPTSPALRIAGSLVRGITVLVLSLVYYVSSGLLIGFGTACTWNGVGPGDSPDLDYPVAGVMMLVLGILIFIFFPRVVKKLTGREVITPPYSGF